MGVSGICGADGRLAELACKLEAERSLSTGEYCELVELRTPDAAAMLAEKAVAARKRVYGNEVFARGLIEFSSYCGNDCLYCGLRASNRESERYRLDPERVLQCCREGYRIGFRTFVLQSGEDPWWTDGRLCELVRDIKREHPGCAVTLSVGERTSESYAALREAGADRYLLRHEAASPGLYRKLHPESMRLEARLECLRELRELGYAVGAGFMVQAPHQTTCDLAADLKFVEDLAPDMCGIGPFVPHHATPFAHEPGGTVELTCYLLSILRIMRPSMLLPATTALGTIDPEGREKGVLSGANVVMPNLSPPGVRKKYAIYDGKICTGGEAAECWSSLAARMERIGYRLVVDRGDMRALPSDDAQGGQ